MKICTTEQEYIDAISLAAQKACKRYGYLPSVLIGQSCLENGYGIRDYWDNPQIEVLLAANNMVGIKSSLLNSSWDEYSVWQGESLTKSTPEYYNGKQVTITDNFRVYDTIERSFCDFLLFLKYASNNGKGGTPKYGDAVLSIKEPETLIKTVNARGYATDENYYTQVLKIIKKHNLTKYDDLTNVEPSNYVPNALKEAKETVATTTKTTKGKKVMLDAGHYGYYNQSPAVKEYWESKMTWKLHLMLKEELEKYGIVVGTTRTNQEKDMALYDRGYASKGYDLFLSIHSNAVDDNVHENIDYPVCFVQISGKSDKIGTLLSECVHDVMGTTQAADHWSVKGNNGDYYGVLRGATAAGTVGCIIEHSFHTQTRAAKWLLNDDNLRKMAVAEAKVINEYLGGSSSTASTSTSSTASGTTASTSKAYLSKGDSGTAVKNIQKYLIAIGFSCGSAGADGDWGNDTQKAFEAFREAYGADIAADGGKCGDVTQKFLKQLYTIIQSGIFNATYYLKKYADLKAAFGTSKAKSFAHFWYYGMKEGRQASKNFKVQAYQKRYEDLRKAFGDDLKSYYLHYVQYGKKEGRKAT